MDLRGVHFYDWTIVKSRPGHVYIIDRAPTKAEARKILRQLHAWGVKGGDVVRMHSEAEAQ